MKKLFLFYALIFSSGIAVSCTVTTSVHNATCYYSCNGSAAASALGVPPFAYSWAPGGQTTQSITGLCRGTYTVTITDALGCQASATATVESNPDILVYMSSTPACYGTCNGTASAQAMAGMGSFTYLWAPGGQTTQTITNQCAGTYTCTVTDGAGCTKSASVTIAQNPEIIPNSTHTDLTCFFYCNGTASVSPTGGSAPYSYLWQPGGQTTSSITGQCAGTFTCLVTDAVGCSNIAQIMITSPPQLSVSISSSNPNCGLCNGSVQSSVSGGIAPYFYTWAPGGQNTASISSQCAGNYSLTVTDANGCSVLRTSTLSGAGPGSLDNTFSEDGKLTTSIGSYYDRGRCIAIQPDGKILVAGEGIPSGGTWYEFILVRYNTDGSHDNTFSGDGIATIRVGNFDAFANAVAIQTDGKIVVAGDRVTTSGQDFALVRFNSNGSLDSTFDEDGIVITNVLSFYNDIATSVAIQPDGKIVAAGFAGGYPEDNDIALVRYNTDGSLDNTFDGDGKLITSIGSGDDEAHSIVIQADGKIVIGGYAWLGNELQNDFAVVRYNTDGTLDGTLDGDGIVTVSAGGTNDRGKGLALQSDGKIVVAGFSYIPSDTADEFSLVRLNTDGSFDVSFDGDGKVITRIGNNDDNKCHAVAIQADGRIVVAGSSGMFSSSDFAVVRYNSDGTLDTTFGEDGKVTTEIGNAGDAGHSVAIQSDGKIVVAGSSDSNTEGDFALARYVAAPCDPSPRYSNVVVPVEYQPIGLIPVVIYPNPANAQLFIQMTGGFSGQEQIWITNILGEVVYTKRAGKDIGAETVDVSALSAGTYFVHIRSAEKMITEKVIKQ